MKYFNLLYFLSKSYSNIKMTVDVAEQAAITEFEIGGKDGFKYKLVRVGWDLCFSIEFEGVEIDNVINLPQESETVFLSRIKSLIKCYK